MMLLAKAATTLMLLASTQATASPQVRRFVPEGPTLVTHPKEAFRDVIRCFVRHGDAIWYGTYGSGLFRISASRIERFTPSNSPLTEPRVNCLASRGPELWIGTCGGIDVTDGSRWRVIRGSGGPAHPILHVLRADSAGRVWAGTTGKGLSMFDGHAWRTFTSANGLPGDWVNDVLEGPDGVVWAACLGGVASLGPSGKWRAGSTREFPLYRNAVALAVQESALWVGFSDDGLFALEAGLWYRPPVRLLPAPTVRALAVDRASRLWVGTESGLATLDRRAMWESAAANAGLRDLDVRALYCDPKDGDLWTGTAEGSVYRRSAEEARWRLVARRGECARRESEEAAK